ncbi:MAG: aminotransferase class I/II-fold pyridoxal phosphate-dependent enzyme, partial [Myxococcota bacterium]|nr:aminotransferase class I/II-fold pyridoxal phosphate-dependent enzyme [Myxococcota bacterium]
MASCFKTKLEQMQAVDRYRVLTSTDGISTTQAERDGRAVTLFSSNDYLGLSRDVRLIQKTKAALDAHGMGPRAASLICGYTSYHENLESVLSRLKGSEGTLLMPSGYQANVGLLSALGGPDAVIFSDELNHASII